METNTKTPTVTVNLDSSEMSNVILHKVGNKSMDEGMRIATNELKMTDGLNESLFSYFVGGFKFDTLYEFTDEHDLSMNSVFKICKRIFEETDKEQNFYKGSIDILRHLYDMSNNPTIKGGDLYVAYFNNCDCDGESTDAIGIFKADKRVNFVNPKFDEDENEWAVDIREGFDMTKIDKGCIIFNTQAETGYRIANIKLKGLMASAWNLDFMNISRVQDDSYQTQVYMDMCKDFANKAYKEDNKDVKVDFLNRTKDYFENYKEHTDEDFKEVVFEDSEKKEAFAEHVTETRDSLELEDEDNGEFLICANTVKKAKKGFKNNILLDTEVEIKILSSQAVSDGYVERGHDDEKDMDFYKVYFNSEK